MVVPHMDQNTPFFIIHMYQNTPFFNLVHYSIDKLSHWLRQVQLPRVHCILVFCTWLCRICHCHSECHFQVKPRSSKVLRMFKTCNVNLIYFKRSWIELNATGGGQGHFCMWHLDESSNRRGVNAFYGMKISCRTRKILQFEFSGLHTFL